MTDIVMVYGDITIAQVFDCNQDSDSFEIYAAPVKETLNSFEVRLFDGNGQLMKSWKTNVTEALKGRVSYYVGGMGLKKGNKYIVEISGRSLSEENAMLVIIGRAEYADSSLGKMQCDKVSEDVEAYCSGKVMKLNVYRDYGNPFIVAALIIVFIILNVCLIRDTDDAQKLALPILIAVGLIFMLSMSPGSESDDDYHYYSAFKLSNAMMGRKDVSIIENKYEYKLYANHHSSESYVEVIEGLFDRSHGDKDGTFVYSGQADGLRWPVSHIAPALGITVGRLLGMNFIQIFTLARLTNLAVYIALVVTAVRLVPKNKEFILFVAMTPTAMQDATQLSYDTIINGISFLFIAYVFKLATDEKQCTWKDVVLGIVMIIAMAPIKVIYGILIFLLFVIPRDRFKSNKDRVATLAISLTGLAGIVIGLSARFIKAVLTVNDSRIEAQTYTIQYAFREPIKCMHIVLYSIDETLWDIFESCIGNALSGAKTINVPEYLPMGLLLIMMLCVLSEKSMMQAQRQKLLFALIGIVGTVAVYVAMMFAATTLGANKIVGVQGRYFIPFLPLLLYSVSRNREMIQVKRMKLFIPFWFILVGYIVNIMERIEYYNNGL
ncbi:MAG: DUF2142 domain-containing protein [Lachnospiraceae bacterium]|nr:DUF2142 domain-containing protein [Lachnospiraceae bacterium]